MYNVIGELEGEYVYVYRTRLKCKKCNDPEVTIAIIYHDCLVTDSLSMAVLKSVKMEHKRNHRNNMFVVNVSKADPRRN